MSVTPLRPDDDPYSRTPPHDVAAEQSVLGAALLSRDALTEVATRVRAADFYRPAHELIYAAATDLHARGEPVDAVTVSAELTRRGDAGRAGGAPYLHTLISTVPTAANADYYARIVEGHATARRLIAAGTSIVQLGYNAEDRAAALDAAHAHVLGVGRARHDTLLPISALLPAALDAIEAAAATGGETAMTGLPTGLTELDELTGGLHGGQLIVVAGRPGSGKSVLGTDACRAASVHRSQPSALFSLEMGRDEIALRLLAAEARIPLHALRAGRLAEDDWGRLAWKMSSVAAAPMYVDDSASLTYLDIAARARSLHNRVGLRLIVVDYLQLLTSGRRNENRQQEVSDMSRSLKLLAKELDVPVMALAQLNRGPEHRADKTPMLSDLRESGALEQDADGVVLIHREDMYDRESVRAGEADLIVAKNRNGPTGKAVVSFQGHYSRFRDFGL